MIWLAASSPSVAGAPALALLTPPRVSLTSPETDFLVGLEPPSLRARKKKMSAATTRSPADTATTMSCIRGNRRGAGDVDPCVEPAGARGVRVGVGMGRQDRVPDRGVANGGWSPPARTSAARQDAPHVFLGLGRDQGQDLVAGMEDGVAPR